MTSKQRIARIRRWLASDGVNAFVASSAHIPSGAEDSDRWITRVELADALMAKELEWLCTLASEVCHLKSEVRNLNSSSRESAVGSVGGRS
jgi:hypothetical protein